MEPKELFETVLCRAKADLKSGTYPISNSELIKWLGIHDSELIAESCIYFYNDLNKCSYIIENESLDKIEFLLKNIMKRYDYIEKGSSENIEKLKKDEFLYLVTKENLVDEKIELRDIVKDHEFQHNYYLSRCGKYDLRIEELSLDRRTIIIAIELKNNGVKLSDEKILKKARKKLDAISKKIDLRQADLKAKERLFAQMENANKAHTIGKTISTYDYSDHLRERRYYTKKFTSYLAYDLNMWEKLTPSQQEKLTTYQQNFVSYIKNDEIIMNKNAMFAGLTTNYTLESLLFQCQELYAAAGIEVPDRFIIYDCGTIEEMIQKLDRGIQFFQFEIDKIKNREKEICEDKDYIKYLNINALSDREYNELIEKYMKKINELETDILKLEQEFHSM